ncbi:Glycolipid transfer protein [Tupaia chinensis]|uniref:Glycolipid transfer protein n=1 Tax=Tupaia chinensis TaxID=246437 RepID=L9KVG9_TUPCH|nr:Glycolipid transfer protein [Tupaia chinensis]
MIHRYQCNSSASNYGRCNPGPIKVICPVCLTTELYDPAMKTKIEFEIEPPHQAPRVVVWHSEEQTVGTHCLGSPVFTPIKADISGNITKIKAVYDTNPTKFRTLQNILEVEKEMYGAEWPKVGATLALMWLKRGLRFIQVFLQSICDGERDENHPNHIRVNATKAYEMALKKYHGWIVQKIFQAALYAAPYKSDFLKALSKGQNVTEEECLEKVRLFLVNYTATIDVIYEMYTKMNAELNYKV